MIRITALCPAFFLVLQCLAPAVHAQSSRTVAGTPGSAVKSSLLRHAALPKWAEPLTRPASTKRTDPVVVLLAETQVHVGTVPASLTHRSVQVNDRNALARIGQYSISYHPLYQKLHLHRIALIRNGQVLDRSTTADIRELQRETQMEYGMYGGESTVQLLLSDVRVGDTLDIAYTVEGSNPVFGKHWSGAYAIDGSDPVELRRLTVTHPIDRPLYWRQGGDFLKDAVTPKITERNGMRQLVFETANIDAVDYEPFVPPDYFPHRFLAFSEHPDWRSVAAWADNLFPRTGNSGALTKLAKQFSNEATPMARATAALRWVQNEVRYFSVSVGENSHRPQVPDVVVKRRYGDCKDKSYLLVSLLGQLGIKAQPVLVSAQAPATPYKTIPSPTWFDHVIVRLEIDGRPFYVDPTLSGQVAPLDQLSTPLPGAWGLVVGSTTTDLIQLPAQLDDKPQYEHIDTINAASFDGDATLDMQMIFRGLNAERARDYFRGMSATELKRAMLARYEKHYPGIELSAAPTPQDASGQNRFDILARFTLPKPIKHADHKYGIPYKTQILEQVMRIPDKLVRHFPVDLGTNPEPLRYRLTVNWPETVRANDPPTEKTIDNAFFLIHEEYTLRGNQLSYVMDYRNKLKVVGAQDVPALHAQAKLLDTFFSGTFNVSDDIVASDMQSSLSIRQLAAMRTLPKLAAMREALPERSKDKELTSEGCDALVQHRVHADMYPASIEKQLEQELAQWKPTPLTRVCAARVLFASARPAAGLAALPSPLPDNAGKTFAQELAWARLHAGDRAGAVADMRRILDSQPADGNNLFLLADAIALYQRAGTSLPQDMREQAAAYPDGIWPRKLLAMQLGAITPDSLLKTIESMPRDARDLALNEAWFYIGQKNLAEGRLDAAREAFAWFRLNGVRTSSVYARARIEDALLHPEDPDYTAARSALKAGDHAAALAKLTLSAARGNPAAQLLMAHMHFAGKGVKADEAEAREWLIKAADGGDATAQYTLSRLIDEGAGGILDAARGRQLRQLAAEQGLADAQAALATGYTFAKGDERNYALALYWAALSSMQGNSAGDIALGTLCENGWGIAKNYESAANLFRTAAMRGNPVAQTYLAHMYRGGRGMARDYGEAMTWYRKAADQQHADAMVHIGQLYDLAEGVKRDHVEAFAWYSRAADLGHTEAIFNLGYDYAYGEGVKQDMHKAEALYRKAAERGYAPAANNLGIILVEGKFRARDPVEAVKWFTFAAERGNINAQRQLGEAFEKGDGTPKDAGKAETWYRRAAEQGDTGAQLKLAQLIRTNGGVKPDTAEAFKWFALAKRGAKKGTSDYLKAGNGLDAIIAEMSAEEVERGQALVAAWQQKPDGQ